MLMLMLSEFAPLPISASERQRAREVQVGAMDLQLGFLGAEIPADERHLVRAGAAAPLARCARMPGPAAPPDMSSGPGRASAACRARGSARRRLSERARLARGRVAP